MLHHKGSHIRKCVAETLKKQPGHNCISCWNLPNKIPTKIWSKQILEANNTDDWWCKYKPFCNTDDIYELQLYSKNRYVTHTKVHISPGGVGGGAGRVLPYMLYRYMYEPLWRFIWFSSSLLLDRVYKWESLGLESGIISRTLINCLKILKITLCKFVDKNNYWENHRFKLEHDEVLKGWFLNEWVRI